MHGHASKPLSSCTARRGGRPPRNAARSSSRGPRVPPSRERSAAPRPREAIADVRHGSAHRARTEAPSRSTVAPDRAPRRRPRGGAERRHRRMVAAGQAREGARPDPSHAGRRAARRTPRTSRRDRGGAGRSRRRRRARDGVGVAPGRPRLHVRSRRPRAAGRGLPQRPRRGDLAASVRGRGRGSLVPCCPRSNRSAASPPLRSFSISGLRRDRWP